MIFTLRIIIFSFFIVLGFYLSVKSIRLRAAITVVYAFSLFWYTFGCRINFHIVEDVSAHSYSISTMTVSTYERTIQMIKTIFGMQANGTLAGTYSEAFVLNCLLFIPLGYLLMLYFFDANKAPINKIGKILLSIIICALVSLMIETLQELTGLGMFDWNDLLGNSIGGAIGVLFTSIYLFWYSYIHS